ncbi:NADPH-dependent F420 reductase [Amycolatopsis sp. NPDC051903]|uniref:NADPH-dependent F420 reductase n=1 Tax=Amycolatopsis sp. NPDC051903 TaxID=3363936 RepID=UPI0037B3A659
MKIAVLGTGMVGTTMATRLVALGHDVVLGERAEKAEHAGVRPDTAVPGAGRGSFARAAAHGDLLVNATRGTASIAVLRSVSAHDLAGKVLIDIANPLEFGDDGFALLTIVNTDSLGERIQRTFPTLKVVKTLNTMGAALQTAPQLLAAPTNVFLGGDHPDAKAQVRELLISLGWSDEHIIDLGGIATARATEMFGTLGFALSTTLGTPLFNIRVEHV